jgi:hypothetical protein
MHKQRNAGVVTIDRERLVEFLSEVVSVSDQAEWSERPEIASHLDSIAGPFLDECFGEPLHDEHGDIVGVHGHVYEEALRLAKERG